MTKALFRTLPRQVQHMLRRRNREWIQATCAVENHLRDTSHIG